MASGECERKRDFKVQEIAAYLCSWNCSGEREKVMKRKGRELLKVTLSFLRNWLKSFPSSSTVREEGRRPRSSVIVLTVSETYQRGAEREGLET